MKILYPLAKRFIAGHNFESAKPKIQRLMDEGFEVSIDYLGELSKNQKDCEKARDQYLEIIDFYKDQKINISIKPTQLGLLMSRQSAYFFLSQILRRARMFGHTVRLDMENSSVTGNTIWLCLRARSEGHEIGCALQANLHRTKSDLIRLIKAGVSVRLVKGAYKERENISWTTYNDISASFFDCAATLRSLKGDKPAIATHDEELLEDIQELLGNPEYFDYEFLYGIRRDLQRDLKNKGYNVRIYVPFGEDWLPYALRRLREWKNLKFVLTNVVREIFSTK